MVFFTTHNTDNELKPNLITGTVKLESVTVSYNRLVELFGPPLKSRDTEKSTVEWIIRLDGQLLTIYDYNSGKAPEKNNKWSIGGFSNSRSASIELALVIYKSELEI